MSTSGCGCCAIYVCFQGASLCYCGLFNGTVIKAATAANGWEGSLLGLAGNLQVRIVNEPTWKVSWSCDGWNTSESYDFGSNQNPLTSLTSSQIQSGAGCCGSVPITITLAKEKPNCPIAAPSLCGICAGDVPTTMFATISNAMCCGVDFSGTYAMTLRGGNCSFCTWRSAAIGPFSPDTSICNFGGPFIPCQLMFGATYGFTAAPDPSGGITISRSVSFGINTTNNAPNCSGATSFSQIGLPGCTECPKLIWSFSDGPFPADTIDCTAPFGGNGIQVFQ